MPEVEVIVGGRPFRVACQDGEEHFLRAAAAMLNTEADALQVQLGKLPETRMLLMAGLMLADRTAAVEDELRNLKAQGGAPVQVEVQVEVPVVPQGLAETLAALAAKAEAMATRVEERAAS